MGTRSLSQG